MKGQTRPQRASRNDVVFALQSLITGPLREAGSSSDMEAFTSLCCMSAIPDGSEDPKALVRSMSDKFIETVKINFCHVTQNVVARQVAQFFFMEWCYRHGHLDGDWHWDWKTEREGDLRYRERIPLQTISGFAN